MKLFSFKMKNSIKLIVSLGLMFSLIGFAEREQDVALCRDIKVDLKNQRDNYFIDEEDIMALMTEQGKGTVIGKPLGMLNLKSIEKRLITNKYVKEAQVFKDLKGNVVIRANLRRPMARLIQADGPDAYISEDGNILPVSDKFSARVVLITGDFVKQVIYRDNLKEESLQPLYRMLRFIQQDGFWRAQVAQMNIRSNGEVEIYPQVTKQIVSFGPMEHIEEKFAKLKLFYKRVLPQKGWNTYSRINLKYEGQIVAE